MYIVIKGDPIDGFEYVGPFDDQASAEEYMDANSNDATWCIKLIDPEADEREPE